MTLACSVESCSALFQMYGSPTPEQLAEPLCPTHQKARLANDGDGCEEIGADLNPGA